MIRKTKRNILRLASLIRRKGYSPEEAAQISEKIFDELEAEHKAGCNVGWTAERKEKLILSKEEWQAEYRFAVF